MAERLTPLRDRANELMADPAELDRLLAQGAEKAREIASVTLGQVYARMGFLPSPEPTESARPMSSVSKVTATTPRVPREGQFVDADDDAAVSGHSPATASPAATASVSA